MKNNDWLDWPRSDGFWWLRKSSDDDISLAYIDGCEFVEEGAYLRCELCPGSMRLPIERLGEYFFQKVKEPT